MSDFCSFICNLPLLPGYLWDLCFGCFSDSCPCIQLWLIFIYAAQTSSGFLNQNLFPSLRLENSQPYFFEHCLYYLRTQPSIQKDLCFMLSSFSRGCFFFIAGRFSVYVDYIIDRNRSPCLCILKFFQFNIKFKNNTQEVPLEP